MPIINPSPSEEVLATYSAAGRLAFLLDQLLIANGNAPDQVALFDTSGNVANAVAAATLTPEAGKTSYITGFDVTGTGATAGLGVTVTVDGIGAAGPLSFTYAAAAGALVANTPLRIEFPRPIAAADIDTDIVVSCPALGAGNTHNVVNAYGYSA